MLRDNLVGLIEPMWESARARASVVAQKRNQVMLQVDQVGERRSKAILAQDFWVESCPCAENTKMAGLVSNAEAHGSRAVCTEYQISHRTIDPQCLENPRPEGAESTLTGNAASPLPAEPRQFRHLSAAGSAVGPQNICKKIRFERSISVRR